MKTRFDTIRLNFLLPFCVLAHYLKFAIKSAKHNSRCAMAVITAAVVLFSSLPLNALAAEAQAEGNPYYYRVVDVNDWIENDDSLNLNNDY